eukprot:m.61031 g.61031  ORF g.61031 m.61031 type:complete len:138 (+) comp7058_c0_seq2:12-425(+)
MAYALGLRLGRREFLPNFQMALVNVRAIENKSTLLHAKKPASKDAPEEAQDTSKKNVAVFRISPKMNKIEVREYLEKIYGIQVEKVGTRNILGPKKQTNIPRVFNKKADYKLAYVTMKDTAFEFPNIFPNKDEKSNS